jgi:hypothetical protein
MRKLAKWAAIFAGLFAVYALLDESHVVRFRLMMEVETPSGLRKSTNILESRYETGKSSYPQAVNLYKTTGEAVFVDLGEGKHVIALLTGGEKGDWADWHRYMLLGAFSETTGRQIKLENLSHERGVALIKPATRFGGASLMPTLVSFTVANNPTSAKVVPPTEVGFTTAFGPNYAFRQITIEFVPAGIWPFNQWAGPWPQWLFGTPITREIEQKLPAMIAELRERNKTMQIERPGDPFRIGLGHLSVR